MSEELEKFDSGQQVQKIAQASLINLNKNKETLVALAATYQGVTIDGINDKENYKIVKKGITDTRSARTSIEKIRKQEKAYILEAGKLLDQTAGELAAIVTPIEESLKKEQDRIDKLQEQEDERLRAEVENKKTARINLLFETGLNFSGTHYKIGELSITPLQVAEYSEAQFEGFIAQANVEFESVQMAIQEEKENQQRIIEDNNRKAEQAEQQSEVDRLQREDTERANKALIQERTDARISQLIDLGFEYNEANSRLNGPLDYIFTVNAVNTISKTDWDAEIYEFNAQVEAEKLATQVEVNEVVEDAKTAETTQPPATENIPSKFGISPGAPDPVLDPRISQLSRMGFKYDPAEYHYTKEGVYIPVLDMQTKSVNEWNVIIDKVEEYLGNLNQAIESELSTQAEKMADYLDTRPFQATIMFSTERPFIDTKIGSATMRIYVTEFTDEANDGLSRDQIFNTGVIGESDLLYMILKGV